MAGAASHFTGASGAPQGIILDQKKPEDRRFALGTLVGTAVEWYDFFIYANAAAIILDDLHTFRAVLRRRADEEMALVAEELGA